MKIMNSKAKKLNDNDMRVLDALGLGEENSKTRWDLCEELEIGDSVLRTSISQLRYHQYPVGLCDEGYFLATKPEELDRIIAEYSARVKKMNNIKNALTRAREKMSYC